MAKGSVDELKLKVSLLPDSPGVYQYLNASGDIIYVGKAKNLKKRVSSYFLDSKDHPAKVRVLVRQIVDIRHIVVPTEADALLLENNLIKTLQPRYNIMLKDDKTYPWIVIRNEPFPRVQSTRRMVRDGSRYFGPYSSVTMQRGMLELIKGLYPLRSCSLNLSPDAIARGRYSVCLEYHIKNCKGPCVGNQTEEEYRESISLISELLAGETRKTKQYLESQMHHAASKMDFEQAEGFRRKIELLEGYVSKSVIVSNTLTNLDVFSLLIDDGVAYCNFVRIVSGAIVNTFTAEFTLGAEQSEEDRVEILTMAIQQISERISGRLMREIVVEFLPEQSLFPDVAFTVPKRGDKLKLLEFSQRGARLFRLEKLKNLEIVDPQRHTDRQLEALRKALRMDILPRYIECFDNSNLQGTNPVAACVVFRNCKPSRKEYRHFNVKTVEGPDDYATMREIISRRYCRIIEEGLPLPDLIVVDGGKGQLGVACEVLRDIGIYDNVRIVGLAERLEEVFFPSDPMPYYLDRKGEALKIMIHIRDEAHRFGLSFHRQKRSKAFIGSELDSIEGIGPTSKEKLLKQFKSISGVRRASQTELTGVVGAAKAKVIADYFAAKK